MSRIECNCGAREANLSAEFGSRREHAEGCPFGVALRAVEATMEEHVRRTAELMQRYMYMSDEVDE